MKQTIYQQIREAQLQQIIVQTLLLILLMQTPEPMEVAMIITQLQECGQQLIVVVIQTTARK